MSRRILMATVAILALAAPAAAEEQVAQADKANQQLEEAEQALESAAGGEQAAETTEAQAPATTAAGEEPAADAEQAPVTAEEEPAEEAAPELAEEQPGEEAAEELAEDAEAMPPPDMTFIEVQDETQFLADEEVIGKDVVNMEDEEVGQIADLVMDQEQKLVGVVLSVGGFLGIGEKWVAVPVDQIDFPTDEQPARLRAAVTEEQLKNAPDFVTRDVVEAEQAAEQAQQQQMEQMQQQQIPAAAPTNQ